MSSDGRDTGWVTREEMLDELVEKYESKSKEEAAGFINEMFDQGYLRPKSDSGEIGMTSLGEQESKESIREDPIKQADLFQKEVARAESGEDLLAGIAMWNKRYDINILRTAVAVGRILRGLGDDSTPFPESVPEKELRMFDPDLLPDPSEDAGWPSEEEVEEAGEPPEYLTEGLEEDDSVSWQDRMVVIALVRQITPEAFSDEVEKTAFASSHDRKLMIHLAAKIAEKSDKNILRMINKHRGWIEGNFDIDLIGITENAVQHIDSRIGESES